MRHRKTEDTMFLLGGALLGAAAMYLLDPESGRRRREQLAETTGEAMGRAGEAIGPAWEAVRERAADVGSRLTEGASALGAAAAERASGFGSAASSFGSRAAGRVSDAAAGARDSGSDMLGGWGDTLGSFGRRWTRRARGYGEDAMDTARDYRDSAWESARDYAARARGMLPWREEKESHAGAYTAAGLTAAALGAGAIYFLDSANGRTRRKMAVDQATRIVNDCGRAFRQTGRYFNDIMNRSRGLAHETRTRFTGTAGVSPETLMQRVRSEMGHVVTNAGAISVMVDNNRDVTLTGRVLASELDALLTTVNKVPGVNQIINRLDVQDTPEAVVGGDAGTTAGQRL
jgi:hypothetical protein